MEPLALTIGILFAGLLVRVCQQTCQDARRPPPPQHEDSVYSTSLLCDALPCRDLPCYHKEDQSDVEEQEEEPTPDAESGQEARPECCICLDPMVHSRRRPLLMLPCGHLYHQSCIRDWHRTENEMPCPQCGYDSIDYSQRITQ